MYRIISVIVFIFSFLFSEAQTTPPYSRMSSSPYYYTLPFAVDYISLPAGCDTSTAFHSVQSRRMGAFYTDTCDKVSYVWMGYWKPVGSGSGTQRPIYGTNGLTQVNDSTLKWGGALSENTTINMAGYNITMPDNGSVASKLILGQTTTSQARLQVYNYNKLPHLATGPFLNNNSWNIFRSYDTVTAANLSTLKGGGLYNRREIFMEDNNLTLSDKYGMLSFLMLHLKDSVRLDPQNADLFMTNNNRLQFVKRSGFSGRSVVQGGLFQGDAIGVSTNQIVITGTTPGNHVNLKGWWSPNISYLYGNSVDSIEYYAGFFSTGRGTGNPRTKVTYNFFAGKPSVSNDTLYGYYSFFDDARIYFAGETGIGYNAAHGDYTQANDPSAMLQVNSTTRGALLPRMTTVQRNAIGSPATGLVVFDTDEDNYYMNTSSGWQPMGGSGLLFARDDNRNNSGSEMSFNAAGQDLYIDSIKAEGNSYTHYHEVTNDHNYHVGFFGGTSFYQIEADDKVSVKSVLSIQPDGIGLFAKSGASGISVGDSINFNIPHSTADSSTYKPLVIGGDGNVTRINYWPGGGGGSVADFPTEIKAYRDMGGSAVAETVGLNVNFATRSVALTDGQIRWIPVKIDKACTVTRVKLFFRTQGNFTGDNNNKVGLYTLSGTTLTQVAVTSNDESIFKAATNSYGNATFTSSYSASPGIYWVAVLWNASATTTAPAISAAAADIGNVAMGNIGFHSDIKMHGFISSQSDLPSTQAMSGISATATPFYVVLEDYQP